jgi:hypothetical protein
LPHPTLPAHEHIGNPQAQRRNNISEVTAGMTVKQSPAILTLRY